MTSVERRQLITTLLSVAGIAYALGIVLGDIWSSDYKFLLAEVLAVGGFIGLARTYRT